MGIRNLGHHSLRDYSVPPLSPRARLLLPFALAGAFFLTCFFLLTPDRVMILGGLMVAYYIPPSGKESLIPLGIVLGIPWWLMAFTLAYLDVVTSLFMILNLDRAQRLPYLGPWISKSLASGHEFMEQRPWLARWRVPGVAFFVMLPLQGTGGVGATIVGIMAGLSPAEILLAVGIGATVECLVFALGSELIIRLLMTNLVAGIAVVVAILLAALLYFIVSRYWKRGAAV
jgi:uncharacterized membrane protein